MTDTCVANQQMHTDTAYFISASVGLLHMCKYSLMQGYGTYTDRLTIHKTLKRLKLLKAHIKSFY
jgi:hypothetical protein